MINYVHGDATDPNSLFHAKTHPQTNLIAHICNNEGGWGSGFVLALSKRWQEPELMFRKESASHQLSLGSIQTVWVGPRLAVVNMVAQDGFVGPNRPRAVHYGALEVCLEQLRTVACDVSATVHMPRIGCGLGGGEWSVVEELIQKTLGRKTPWPVPVFVYDLTGDYSK